MTTINTINTFHPNSNVHWYDFITLCDSNKDHNSACKITSKSCSKDMSQYNDLCLWHYYRMASHHKFSCDCDSVGSDKYYCFGDSTGRHIFREYYNCWDIPVQDTSRQLYCCGRCQNTDTETHMCGRLLVGDCCIDKHPNSTKIKNDSDDSDNSDDSNE